MRSRYDIAPNSGTKSTGQGTYYKDICAIPMQKFRYTTAPQEHAVTSMDAMRLDILMHRLYGVPEFDDFVLWLNKIKDPTSMTIGGILRVPSRTDVESFYYRYRL